MPRAYQQSADQPASFADFLALWDDAREQVTTAKNVKTLNKTDGNVPNPTVWFRSLIQLIYYKR